MRYGALPLVPDTTAYHDYVVDIDVASHTGDGLLYRIDDPYEHGSVVARAAMLRANPDVWQPLQKRILRAAPRWEAAAAQFESLCLSRETAG
jgi:glycogen synthase